MIKEYSIGGMTCAACSASVERAVRRVQGVDAASVNLSTERLTVRSETDLSSAVFAAVEKTGFTISNVESIKKQSLLESERRRKDMKQRKQNLIIALAFTIPLFYISMGHMVGLPIPKFMTAPKVFSLVQIILLIPVIYAGRGFYVRGFKAIATLHPNMDSLIALGTIAAIGYSIYSTVMIFMGHHEMMHEGLYYESAGVIITLVMLGKYLEQRAKAKTGDAVAALIGLTPDTARIVLKDGSEISTKTNKIEIDGQWYWLEYDLEDQYNGNYWTAGNTYEVRGTFLGASDTFNVKIAEVVIDHIIGDANGDGNVNGIDINYMKRALSGTFEKNIAMDINGDGKVNGTDINLLKRYLVGSYVI